MLRSLHARCLESSGSKFTLQAIITKADAITESGDNVLHLMRKQIFEAAPTCLPPIITSALMRPPFGIEHVRKSIIDACGFGEVR
jgi:GTP-binding protein